MRHVIIILSTTLFLISCTRTIYEPITRIHKEIDTVTQILSDSSSLYALFECDSLNRVRIKEIETLHGKMANSKLEISNGRVEYKTSWQTKYIDRVKEIRDTITVIEVKEVVREVKHIPKLYKWCMAICIIVLGWGVVKIIIRIKGK